MNSDENISDNIFSSLTSYSDNQGNDLIREIEARYSFENEMIMAISKGNIRALNKKISAGMFISNIEQRMPDRLRNLKNYMIIYNTLLRKGAEAGKVHPFYIHDTSADFAIRIEKCRNERDIEQLWSEMAAAYCNLVQEHTLKGYSPLVQNIVMLIDANMGEKLTLSFFAEKFNVNKNYLSTLFKKDTGVTLTEYVNEKRIDRARLLLETTSYQIQDISHSCGFHDVNYFVKVFKKHTDMTPLEYRRRSEKADGNG